MSSLLSFYLSLHQCAPLEWMTLLPGIAKYFCWMFYPYLGICSLSPQYGWLAVHPTHLMMPPPQISSMLYPLIPQSKQRSQTHIASSFHDAHTVMWELMSVSWPRKGTWKKTWPFSHTVSIGGCWLHIYETSPNVQHLHCLSCVRR